MKKVFAILSLVTFIAVNVSVAQTPAAPASKETKKEATVAKADEKTSTHSCCKNGSMKNCSAEQKAACEKAGNKACCAHGDKSKAEAAKSDSRSEKKEGTKANNN